MNTATLKQFIHDRIMESKNFRSELLAHDIEDVRPARWSRTRKRRIPAEDLDQFEFLYEDMARDMEEAGMASLPIKWDVSKSCHTSRPLSELYHCIERGFLHKDGDCYVGIITDPGDSAVVAWFAQVD